MNLIPCKSVEFWRDVRGPGPRNQSDTTATFVTSKIRPGNTEPSPTGLVILWDRASHAVLLIKPTEKSDPCTVHAWGEVRRILPETYAWAQAEAAEQDTQPEVPGAKRAHGGR